VIVGLLIDVFCVFDSYASVCLFRLFVVYGNGGWFALCYFVLCLFIVALLVCLVVCLGFDCYLRYFLFDSLFVVGY